MAWVTFEDLLAKAGVAGASKERIDPFGAVGSASPVFNAGNLKKLTKNEEGALYELYNSAIEVMKQAGVPPDSVRQISNVTDSGDFSYEIPNWNLDTIKNTLTSRGVNLAYDPSRDKGNYGSTKSYSIQLGVLDAAGNPIQEYRAGEGSLASGFFKGFVVPFATLALGAGGAATSIGSSIVGSAAPAAVQKAVGSAVISGASTALTGGDAEDVIKNALTAGAASGVSSLLTPYVQDAIDFVKDLSPGELEQVASSVDAAAGAGDVAGDVGAVDVGGAGAGYVNPLEGGVGFDYAGGTENVALAQMTPQAQSVYLDSLAQGLPQTTAFTRALAANAAAVNAAATEPVTNALAPSGSAPAAATQPAGFVPTPQGDIMSTPTAVTPTGLIPTVETTALPERPLAGTTGLGIATTNFAEAYDKLSPAGKNVFESMISQGVDMNHALIQANSIEKALAEAGFVGGADTSINALTAPPPVATVDLTGSQNIYDPYTGLAENFPITDVGTAANATGFGAATGAAGAGALGAGALGAEAAGAAGTVGNGLTVPPGAGLGEESLITTPGGTSSTVAGGTGITPGTTGGAGLDTSGLALGGTLGAGAALGSALPVGSAAAGGSAITPPAAATPTGIPMVDDFLNYLGTPAGALALSAFGSLAGGYFQGQAAKEAAQTQATAAQNALKLQQDMFEYQKSLLDPYQKAGKAALDRLTGTMGLGGTGSPQQMLEMDPGYAFRLGEGLKALERVQAARGNMLSGGAIKAGQRYAQDVASQEYGNAYNRLSNIAGLGQTAGTQLGAAGQQFGQTAGSAMGDVANSLAAGRIQRTGAYTGAVSDVANAYTDYFNRQQQNQLFRDIYGRRVGG